MKRAVDLRSRSSSEAAVSDVVGSILLVGITVTMMAGVGALVLNLPGPPDRVHAELRIDVLQGGSAWGEGDEVVRVTHMGGEELPHKEARVTISIDGTTTTYQGAALDGGFSDGTLSIGESWQVTTTIAQGAVVETAVISDRVNEIVASQGAIAKQGGANPTTSTKYVDSFVTTLGTVSSFSAAKSASDSGAEASIAEETITSGSGTSRRSAASVDETTGTLNPNHVLASDGSRATFKAANDLVTVVGFTAPGGAGSISNIKIGFEGQRTGGGANAEAVLSYELSGVAGATSQTFTVSASQDTDHLVDITADRAWAVSDVANIELRLMRMSADASFRDILVDHMFIVVTYTGSTTTDADVQFRWVGVPTGTHELQIRHRVATETFDLQVYDGSAWATRGALTSTTADIFSYTLTAAEHNGGAPRVRFIDKDTGASAGTLFIDYARVVTT